MKKGKLIVFYGINNLGKSTQARILIENLKKRGIKAEYIKYPIYNLKPTGPFINQVLRSGKKQKISEEELQMWYTLNRFQFEPKLKEKLANGIWIAAEDYVGTGLAWGWSKGADLKYLENMNKFLVKEDLSILFYGKRFLDGKEKIHLHESNDELMKKCQKKHQLLAKKYHWKSIYANSSRKAISDLVWQKVHKLL
ncbi:MAG: hypothetical protein COX39_01385 [Candidatus Nealsonbacteria bacterium CG23_combo_of_CG06-09_8_20_14_all_40_13]|uniref:Thymidylate kinase-like domain-containing protein n=1 Tax=Candidatus Nealsonbacteria bacterium CG23_combo_of_CG06-09_8_20_14_all_40_13 TaxID=1974724 RepID=A0A2G9YT89_9BACT|nr:MAG: hypothetical protein COX39_01385 [Candidatus Nealsonbacteria bacterium CG23_combo_of_CG06-09_8_20_14_all_40_13]PIR71301.1 MAG: hypothetical protein COU44_00285 [Candidatus Nealsonbacteria bacterium CG10_big_fil_rev_8_21_14_0_10_40_24]